ncbi:sensor histidine kinase [Paenibacillus sp. S-38]|uniref:sensor histidine kinase n=1 Tax=Paenibacillus sp. S-38 TaxID=3416710 RepID=UPI003CEA60DF
MERIISSRKKKPVKLSMLFVRYLSVFCIGTPLLVAVVFILFYSLLSSGSVLPANFGEKQVRSATESVEAGNGFVPDSSSDVFKYAIYRSDGGFTDGGLAYKRAESAKQLMLQTDIAKKIPYYYAKAVSPDGDIYIFQYSLWAQYATPDLRKWLPAPELLAFFAFCAAFLIFVAMLATAFGRQLSRKMDGLKQATRKVQNQDLDFDIKWSGVAEIDDVLYSISTMNEALKESLNRQWKLEKNRREQISALAHDIRTPLTVVLGNAELLAETQLSGEQSEYTAFILDSSRQMEQYMNTLITMTKMEKESAFLPEAVDSITYFEKLENQTAALASVKKIKALFSAHGLPASMCVDPELLERAVMNVISNAVDFSPEQGEIEVVVTVSGGMISLCVRDSGLGFSPAALRHSVDQFFMDDTSRRSNSHFGMGLYIANHVMSLHKGTLRVANCALTGSGLVTLEWPA